jgi:RNA polymerase subunit RPABC4/transcription elongation factor Spt4
MKVCPSCKEYKEGDEKFCKICGAKLLEKIICEGTDESESKCRKLLDPNDNFCAQCGQRVIKKTFKDSGKKTNFTITFKLAKVNYSLNSLNYTYRIKNVNSKNILYKFGSFYLKFRFKRYNRLLKNISLP